MNRLWYKISKSRTVRFEIVGFFIYPAFMKLRYQIWTLYQLNPRLISRFLLLRKCWPARNPVFNFFPSFISSITTFFNSSTLLVGLRCFASCSFSTFFFNVLFRKTNKSLIAWKLIEQASSQRDSSFPVDCK